MAGVAPPEYHGTSRTQQVCLDAAPCPELSLLLPALRPRCRGRSCPGVVLRAKHGFTLLPGRADPSARACALSRNAGRVARRASAAPTNPFALAQIASEANPPRVRAATASFRDFSWVICRPSSRATFAYSRQTVKGIIESDHGGHRPGGAHSRLQTGEDGSTRREGSKRQVMRLDCSHVRGFVLADAVVFSFLTGGRIVGHSETGWEHETEARSRG
jgi:hypothetical protein